MVRSWSSARVSAGKPPSSRSTSRRQAPTAPGTTVSVSSADSARRSRFCATIYSSACQRVIMLMRLPTLALPATAPISGSVNQRTSREMVVRLELGVGIQRHHHFALRIGQAHIQRIGLAAIGNGDHAHPRLVHEMRADDIGGVVLGAVIDHQHFQVGIVAGQNALDGGDDDFLFVEGGDQHRHHRRRSVRRAAARPALAPASTAPAPPAPTAAPRPARWRPGSSNKGTAPHS